MPFILQMNFEFDGSPETLKQQGAELANILAQVPGLVWKIWLMDEAQQTAGGIYLFESKAAAEAYLAGDVGQSVRQNPAFRNLKVRLTPVWAEPTAITASPVIPAAVPF